MTADRSAGLQTGTTAASRLLLTAANRLNRQTRKGDAAAFNLFTVLRSPADEVNLHSRFLHALLQHRTKFLADFLQRFCTEDFLQRFCPDGRCAEDAVVEREKNGIDVLIIRRRKWAVAIENKIGAGDQPSQLFRYHLTLASVEGIGRRSHLLLYLSPDGHEPSQQSLQDDPHTRDPNDEPKEVPPECWRCISYEDLLPWLEDCQAGATGDHGLHASITQYLQVVREMTGRHMAGQQMETLKELIRETGTIGIAREVGRAADEVRYDVVEELWCKIESALKQALPKGFNRRTPSATDRDRIEQTFGLKKRAPKKWHGLYFSRTEPAAEDELGPAPALGVEINGDEEFFFGVRCLREGATEKDYDAVERAVAGSRHAAEFRRGDHPWWPCRRYVLPDSSTLTDEQLAKLSGSGQQEEIARRIAQQLVELWDLLRKDDGTGNLF